MNYDILVIAGTLLLVLILLLRHSTKSQLKLLQFAENTMEEERGFYFSVWNVYIEAVKFITASTTQVPVPQPNPEEEEDETDLELPDE